MTPPGVRETRGVAPPSLHLAWEELACRDGAPYPVDYREDGRLAVLVAEFEALRAACGPLLVNSAYRTPAWNTRVGGKPNSQHLYGRALDLVPVRCSLMELYAAARRRSVEGAIRGIGRYRNFLHIDTRPSDRLVEWEG